MKYILLGLLIIILCPIEYIVITQFGSNWLIKAMTLLCCMVQFYVGCCIIDYKDN